MSSAKLKKSYNIDLPQANQPKNPLEELLYSSCPIKKITSKKQYDLSLKVYDELFEKIEGFAKKEQNVINSYLELLANCIEDYEEVENDDLYEGVEFHHIVDELLSSKGLRRKDLIPIFGDKTLVSKYVNKNVDMKMKYLSQMANLLGCDISFLASSY